MSGFQAATRVVSWPFRAQDFTLSLTFKFGGAVCIAELERGSFLSIGGIHRFWLPSSMVPRGLQKGHYIEEVVIVSQPLMIPDPAFDDSDMEAFKGLCPPGRVGACLVTRLEQGADLSLTLMALLPACETTQWQYVRGWHSPDREYGIVYARQSAAQVGDAIDLLNSHPGDYCHVGLWVPRSGNVEDEILAMKARAAGQSGLVLFPP